MNQINFLNDLQDLTDALNEEEDIFSPPTIAIKPSSYFELEEFLQTNAEPHFYNNFPCYPLTLGLCMVNMRSLKTFCLTLKIGFP